MVSLSRSGVQEGGVMFIKVGEHIINANQIIEVKTWPAIEAGWDEDEQTSYPARPVLVHIVTTGNTSQWHDGGDFPEFKHTDYHPYVISLRGENAERFLEALPVYEPVLETEAGQQ